MEHVAGNLDVMVVLVGGDRIVATCVDFVDVMNQVPTSSFSMFPTSGLRPI